MQRSSAAIQAAKTHWKISWKLPVQQCKNDQLQKSKIEEKYRKMYKKRVYDTKYVWYTLF